MSDPLMPQLNSLACAWTRARLDLMARREQRCRAALAQMYGYYEREV